MPPSISNSLIAWYRSNRRDLPWRRSDNPYAVLVSEVMLQQTQVATVVPYFERFIERFPTVQSLAAATESEALRAWEGLGYYRRVRNLRAAATVVSESGWPDDLQSLPGVGKYTSAALGSIAFGRQIACADGNVRRVFSRFRGKECSLSQAEAESAAMMCGFNAGEWNQAVMELGATVCKAKSPECHECPIRSECAAHSHGNPEALPAPVASKTKRLEHVCICPVRGKRVGVRRCGAGEWWEGLYDFPKAEVRCGESAGETAVRLGLKRPKAIGTLHHTVTNHRIRLHAFVGNAPNQTSEWRTLEQLRETPMSRPARRVCRWLEAHL